MTRPCAGKHIDWKKVDDMLIAGCNGVQVAAAIGVHPDTLYNRCFDDHGINFSAYLQQKRAVGDSTIHSAQYEAAVSKKNVAMLIWLGKQRLGQKERSEDEVNKDSELKFDLKMAHLIKILSDEQIAKLEAHASRNSIPSDDSDDASSDRNSAINSINNEA